MSEMIDTAAAVRLLQGMEDVAILCHKSPDGDTLGCGFALLYALQKLGKRVVVLCKDPLPDRYAYLGEGTHTDYVAVATHYGDSFQQMFRLVAIHDDAAFGFQLPCSLVDVQYNDIHAQVQSGFLSAEAGTQT